MAVKRTQTSQGTSKKRLVKADSKSVVRTHEKSTESKTEKSKIVNITKRRLIVILVILIAAAFLYYFKGYFIVAMINGQPITRVSYVKELEKQSGKQVLNALVTKTLIYQEANKRRITISQSEIDQDIKRIQNNLSKQGQNLDQALALQGLSKQDLVEQIKLQKFVEKILGDKVKVTDKEIDDYISKNKDSFKEDITSETKSAVKQQLQQQKFSKEFQSWLDNAQRNAKINYFIKG